MKSLLLDIGNTVTKIAISEDEFLEETFKHNDGDLINFLESKINTGIEIAVVSSVRNIDELLIKFLKEKIEKVLILDNTTNIPIQNLYSSPETLGADRLAAAIGSTVLFPNENCMIFDFGTAMTIDFVSDKGEYLGGNISLGLKTRFKATNHFTEKLPALDVPEIEIIENTVIGKTTKKAIENGVLMGLIFEIEGYIRTHQDFKVIFTGGDAFYFADKVKSPIFVVCNLVLVGLSYIARHNLK